MQGKKCTGNAINAPMAELAWKVLNAPKVEYV